MNSVSETLKEQSDDLFRLFFGGRSGNESSSTFVADLFQKDQDSWKISYKIGCQFKMRIKKKSFSKMMIRHLASSWNIKPIFSLREHRLNSETSSTCLTEVMNYFVFAACAAAPKWPKRVTATALTRLLELRAESKSQDVLGDERLR